MHCAHARFVWNLALEQANCYRPGRPTPGSAERFRQLAEARAGTWLGEGSSSVQTTTALVHDFDLIAVEDLAVKSMVGSARGTLEAPGVNVAQKRGLNRAISAQAWSMLRRRLTDKAATCGVAVVAVDPAYTSQRCAACGHTCPENRDSQAVFRCRACGHQANADVNAAVNILAAGLAVTARGGTSHQGPDETRTQPVAA